MSAATLTAGPLGDLLQVADPLALTACRSRTRTGGRTAAGRFDPSSDHWFHDFYAETAARLRAYVGQLVRDPNLADDLTQEAYLRLLRVELPSGDFQRLRGYLYRTATNLARDHWRSRKRRPEVALDLIAEPSARAGDVSAGKDLERLLRQLKRQQRSLLWLAYVEGASHREIAQILDVKEASVRVLLFRARQKMARLIRDNGMAPEGAR